jgi:hypothetical protein
MIRLRSTRAPLAAALLLALAGCGASDAGAPAQADTVAAADAPPVSAARRAELVDEVHATLQACSYDGAPVRVPPGAIGSAALPTDCRDMVAQIMEFTGLPQNFTVVEAPVPNAAALIMLDQAKVPQRVIAFNRDFIGLVRNATGGNAWAPVSVMAHEIGHHLSGHTITPGGSQPPTELEADKFSGFVLYKMGASLGDAQKAMATLVREGPDGATHPGRGRRLAAIAEGWEQACEQQGGDDCASGAGVLVHEGPAPVSPAPARAEPIAPVAAPATAPVAGAPATIASARAETLPRPGSTPSKFTRFVADEYGWLDPSWRARFERQMFEHAQAHGVEIVTLLVRDLHGLDADAYAQAMLRQLRVGKLDVGNGAVLVVAPAQNQVGLAMGPGIALQMGSHDKKGSLQRWLQSGWPECERKQACGNWTETLMLAADHIRRDTDDVEWKIRYASLQDLMQAYNGYHDGLRESGGRFDPAQDPGNARIAMLEGEVVDLAPPPGNKAAWVNTAKAGRGIRAVHVRGGDYTLMLYVDPRTEALMPAGALQEGRRYRFVARTDGLSWNPKDTQAFDLLSWDLLP